MKVTIESITRRIYLNDTLHIVGNVVFIITGSLCNCKGAPFRNSFHLVNTGGHVGASTVTKMKATILHANAKHIKILNVHVVKQLIR